MRVHLNTAAVMPEPGQLLRLTQTASPQFLDPIFVRVLRIIDEWTTYQGWAWMDVYQIGLSGEAVEKRRLFVKVDGLEFVEQQPARPVERRPRNQRPEGRPRVQPERVFATAAGRRII